MNRLRRALSAMGPGEPSSFVLSFDNRHRREAPARDVLVAVAAYYGVSQADLVGHGRNTFVVEARHMAMYLLRDYLMLSWSQVGRLLDRDHSTVMSAVGKVRRRIRGGYQDAAVIVDKIKDAQSTQPPASPETAR